MKTNDFRCKSCHQLQFKYKVIGNKMIIEIKCYNCNAFSYFTIFLDKTPTDKI